jgi:hypothetical protein
MEDNLPTLGVSTRQVAVRSTARLEMVCVLICWLIGFQNLEDDSLISRLDVARDRSFPRFFA